MENTLTNKMRIDVLALLKEKNMSNKFPQINKWKPYVHYIEKPIPKLPFREVFAYIFLLYSNDSILNKEPMPPLYERQSTAATMVGFQKDKEGEFNKEITDKLFNLEDERIIDLIFTFLVYQGDKEWHEIITDEKLRQDYLRDLMSKFEDEDPKKKSDTLMVRSKLRAEVEKINKDLNNKYKEMFGGSEKLIIHATQEIQMSTIESYAD